MIFDTPGENETQLNEDLFETQILEHFKENRFLCKRKIAYMAFKNMGSGELSKGFDGVARANVLMENISYDIAKKFSRGYRRTN